MVYDTHPPALNLPGELAFANVSGIYPTDSLPIGFNLDNRRPHVGDRDPLIVISQHVARMFLVPTRNFVRDGNRHNDRVKRAESVVFVEATEK